MKKRDIPKPILEKIENELLAGERLLWAGIPGRHRAPNPMMLMSLIAGLVALLGAGITIFFYKGGAIVAVLPAIIIIMVALAGLSITLQQYSKPQAYAVTNRRAIILSKKSVQSFGPQELQSIERKMNRNGTGDIIFRKEYYKRPTIAGTVYVESRSIEPIGFLGVENPVELEALILETFQPEDANHKRLEILDSYEDQAQDDYLDSSSKAQTNYS